MSKYKNIELEVEKKKKNIVDLNTLDEFRSLFLGKKGSVSIAMKDLGKLDPEDRKKSAEELSKATGGLNLPLDFKIPF